MLLRVARGELRATAQAADTSLQPAAAYSAHVVELCSFDTPTEISAACTKAVDRQLAKKSTSEESLFVDRIFALLQLSLYCIFNIGREPDSIAATLSGFADTTDLLREGLSSEDSAVRESIASGILDLCVRDTSGSGDDSLGMGLLMKLLFDVLPLWQFFSRPF
jgi:hypothetical protein